MKRIIIIIVGVFSCVILIKAQYNVSFFEEHIDFSLENNYFTINGIYSFSSKTGRNEVQKIIFPFDQETHLIDSIRIVNLNTSSDIDFKRLRNSVSFQISVPANDTVDLNICYRQKITATNKYIITSTQSWGEPLKKAVYSLTTDRHLKIRSFSYEPDSVSAINKKTVYWWVKHAFMPTKDFEVTLNDSIMVHSTCP